MYDAYEIQNLLEDLQRENQLLRRAILELQNEHEKLQERVRQVERK